MTAPEQPTPEALISQAMRRAELCGTPHRMAAMPESIPAIDISVSNLRSIMEGLANSFAAQRAAEAVEQAVLVALEQRCERTFSQDCILTYKAGERTPWDLACTTIADAIRARAATPPPGDAELNCGETTMMATGRYPHRKGFHWKDNWYFTRLPHGVVAIAKFASREAEDPEFEIKIPAEQWASIMSSVSDFGETSVRYQQALDFHGGARLMTDQPPGDAGERAREIVTRAAATVPWEGGCPLIGTKMRLAVEREIAAALQSERTAAAPQARRETDLAQKVIEAARDYVNRPHPDLTATSRNGFYGRLWDAVAEYGRALATPQE